MYKNKESINQLPLPLPLLRTPQHMPFHRDRAGCTPTLWYKAPTANARGHIPSYHLS